MLFLEYGLWNGCQITNLRALLAQPSSPSDCTTKESHTHTHARTHARVCVHQPCDHWLSNNLQIFIYWTVTSLNGYQFSTTTDMVHVNLTEPDTLLTLVDFSNAFWLLRVSPLAIFMKKYCANSMKGAKHITTSPRRHTKKRASPIPNPSVAIDCSTNPTRWPVACK